MAVKEGKKPTINKDTISKELTEKKGCFVTLTKNGELRGCIGHIIAQESLVDCVIDNAVNAALYDTRFTPVAEDELKQVSLDINVLSAPTPLEYTSPQDLLDKLVPKKDGVVLSYNWRSSTFLPIVWEQLQDKEQFLTSLCYKQGSEGDCWKKGAKVEIYHTFEFNEEDFR